MNCIDIVIPVYNEGPNLVNNILYMSDMVSDIKNTKFQFIIVNDGSDDDVLSQLYSLCSTRKDINLVTLTRNFGKEAAILAGLIHSQGNAAIVIDSDLQHPPHLINKMIAIWENGIDVVEGCKKSRGPERSSKKLLTYGFYAIYRYLAKENIQAHTDFKLLDRKVVEAYCLLPERKRFFRGLVPWLGFSSACLYFDVPERSQGKSSWTPLKLFRLSIDALTGFSSAPLYLINILGVLCFAISAIIGSIALYYKFMGLAVSGFTTVILLILLIGSFIMFGLGLLGIYVGQIFEEVKKRPVYMVDYKKSTLSDSQETHEK